MERKRRIRSLAFVGVASLFGCTSELPPYALNAPPQAVPSLPPDFIPPAPINVAPPASPTVDDFKGKFVVLNHWVGDEVIAVVLETPTVKKLGGRDFLVGKVVSPDENVKAGKKKASAWVPVEHVDSIIVFENKDDAFRETTEEVGQRM